MMLSSDAIASVIEVLIPEDFFRQSHRVIYQVVLDLYGRGEPVDAVTVVEELKRTHQVQNAEGPLYVHDLVTSVPTSASAPYYAKIVAENALLRRLIDAASDIMADAYAVPDDPLRAADEAEQRIYSVARRRDQDAAVAVGPVINAGMEALERAQQRDNAFGGVPTGFRDLDAKLSGLHPSDLIILAARPGAGKSALAVNIARNVAVTSQKAVLFFSLEMSRFDIAMRLLCAEARVPYDRVRSARVDTHEWSKYSSVAGDLHDASFFIVDSGSVNVVEIRAKARRMKSGPTGLDLVVVDYLQLMGGHRRFENRQQEIAEISRSLKLLAKELEVPVIAVSQLNRNPEARADKRPQLSDLRESGQIEQDADVVLLIHRDMDPDKPDVRQHAEVFIAKHRNGPIGKVDLTFLESITTFTNFARA
jgi:replicative DNA helicase